MENQKPENLRKAVLEVLARDSSVPIVATDISESPEDFDGKEHNYQVFYGDHIKYNSGPGILGR